MPAQHEHKLAARIFNYRDGDATHPSFGAVGNGATDDRAALAAVEAAGSVGYLPPGTYRVASNLTLSRRWSFASGARLKPDAGVTITMGVAPDAGVYQIFDLSAGGAIKFSKGFGSEVLADWFGARIHVPVVDEYPDSYAAIKAAIASVPDVVSDSGGVKVRLGRDGAYHSTRPIQILRGNVTLAATGYGTELRPWWSGLAGGFAVVLSSNTSFPTTTALLTGAGSALNFSAGYDWMLNLRDSRAGELNGMSQICIELTYRPSQATVGNENIISSSGQLLSTGTLARCFSIGADWDGVARADLNVGGTTHGIRHSAALVAGTTYHLALDYNGSTVRFFVNGVLAGSVAASGNLVQRLWEDVVIGRRTTYWPELTSTIPFQGGAIDSVRISNVSRYSANFTPPTAKFTNDANTRLLLNFDDNEGICTKGTTAWGTAWFAVREYTSPTYQDGSGVEDMTINGGFSCSGIYDWQAQATHLRRLKIRQVRDGILMGRDSYLSRIQDVDVRSVSTDDRGRYGILNQSAGVTVYRNVSIEGGKICFVSENAGVELDNVWCNWLGGIAAMLLGNRAGANATARGFNVLISDEASASNPDAIGALILRSLRQGEFSGTIEVLQTAAPPVVQDTVQAFAFRATRFDMHASTAHVVKVEGAPTKPVLLDYCTKSTAAPWASDLTAVTLRDS